MNPPSRPPILSDTLAVSTITPAAGVFVFPGVRRLKRLAAVRPRGCRAGAGAGGGHLLLVRPGRGRHPRPPGRIRAAGTGRQHAVAGARRGHRRQRAGRVAGLAHGDVRLSRPPPVRLGAAAAAGAARLRHRLRRDWPAGFHRPAADLAARELGPHRPARDPLARRRHPGDVAGALSLCLSDREKCLRHAGRDRAGGGAVARALAHAGLLPGGPADGAAVDRRRPDAGADGNAGRFRHHGDLQLRHLHHRHLQGVVQPVFAGGGGAARLDPDPVRAGRGGIRAALAHPDALRRGGSQRCLAPHQTVARHSPHLPSFTPARCWRSPS